MNKKLEVISHKTESAKTKKNQNIIQPLIPETQNGFHSQLTLPLIPTEKSS